MRRFLSKLANLFRGGRAESELAREIETHLALLQEDFERQGLTPEKARLAAKREYGGIEQAKELHRSERSFVWIEQFFKDIRYGWINLLRNPGFMLVAVIALALGIGVNATIFGIYNAVALKQLLVADPDRVVRLERWFELDWRGDIQYNFAYPEYQYLRDHNNVFSGLVASSFEVPVLASIAGEEMGEHLSGHAVSANYFTDLGVPAHIGRTFAADEDRTPGANTVIVLSGEFWQRKFHRDPNVLGQTIKLNGVGYTIIGVAPETFTGTDILPTRCDFWAPLSMIDQLEPGFGLIEQWRDPTSHSQFEVLARLKGGVAREKAQAEAELLIHQYLSGYRETNRTKAITLQRTAYFGKTEDPRFQASVAGVLMVVSLVLLAACANVANMLLARGATRQREIGVRMALGASRSRIVRQLLTESILLSFVGGAVGVLASVWASKLLWTSMTSIFQGSLGLRTDMDVSPDAHVFLYGFMLALATGIVFGLAPALQFTRPDLNSAIKREGSALGVRLSRSRLRGLLLGTQVAVSVLLLLTSGGLIAHLVNSGGSDPGFRTRDALLPDDRRRSRERASHEAESAGASGGASRTERRGDRNSAVDGDLLALDEDGETITANFSELRVGRISRNNGHRDSAGPRIHPPGGRSRNSRGGDQRVHRAELVARAESDRTAFRSRSDVPEQVHRLRSDRHRERYSLRQHRQSGPVTCLLTRGRLPIGLDRRLGFSDSGRSRQSDCGGAVRGRVAGSKSPAGDVNF